MVLLGKLFICFNTKVITVAKTCSFIISCCLCYFFSVVFLNKYPYCPCYKSNNFISLGTDSKPMQQGIFPPKEGLCLGATKQCCPLVAFPSEHGML